MSRSPVVIDARIEHAALGPSVVHLITDDHVEHVAFRFFADEVTFRASDFVGRTLDYAHTLHFARDVAYLRS